jgi:hypothetical protein
MVMLVTASLLPSQQLVVETLQGLSTQSFSIKGVAVANNLVGI